MTGPAVTHSNERDIADYVGGEACRPCHAREFAQNGATMHAHSLRPMTREALGVQCPPTGQINGSQYALVEKGGRFFFEVDPPAMPDKYQLWPLNYVFGSGRRGISFVSMLEDRNVVEMKMSWYPRERVWRVTPGQKLDNAAAAGNVGNLDQSRHCIGCHTVAMSRSAFEPRPEFFGVGCESCHGPGRAHIAAVKARAADIRMSKLGMLGARDLNTLCGKCHQTEKDVAASPELAKMTYRFQPYGLMRSRCFRESGDRLSCLTCHNAHADAVTDRESYTPACLSCHGPAPADAALAGHGKPCPVNATSGCVNCHMPKRDILDALGRTGGSTLTEHLIAVYPTSSRQISAR